MTIAEFRDAQVAEQQARVAADLERIARSPGATGWEVKIWQEHQACELPRLTCPTCERLFETSELNRKYCSRACSNRGFVRTRRGRAVAEAQAQGGEG